MISTTFNNQSYFATTSSHCTSDNNFIFQTNIVFHLPANMNMKVICQEKVTYTFSIHFTPCSSELPINSGVHHQYIDQKSS